MSTPTILNPRLALPPTSGTGTSIHNKAGKDFATHLSEKQPCEHEETETVTRGDQGGYGDDYTVCISCGEILTEDDAIGYLL